MYVGTMRTSDASLGSAFILLLFLPLLALLHPGLDAAQRYTEKRPLAELPAGSAGCIPSSIWPDGGVHEWFSDHFGFRSILFRWNAMLHAVVMHTSPLPDRLLMGKDGWMYLTNDKVIDQYQGQKLFTFATNWNGSASRLEKRQASGWPRGASRITCCWCAHGKHHLSGTSSGPHTSGGWRRWLGPVDPPPQRAYLRASDRHARTAARWRARRNARSTTARISIGTPMGPTSATAF